MQPLPYHAKDEYNQPPGKLEDEWVYRHHPEDWQNYHTRYVTAEPVAQALAEGHLGAGPRNEGEHRQ